jgi:hypothetical protein
MNYQCKESHIRAKNGFILDWITQATVQTVPIMRMARTEAVPDSESFESFHQTLESARSKYAQITVTVRS